MKINRIVFTLVLALTYFTPILAQEAKWESLLDSNLSKWDKYMGVPHTSVEGLADDVPKGNGMEGTALGLNNDPLNVFSMKEEGGEPVLYVSGQVYGGLTSKEVYENYHLKLDFKWGEKKWEPRLKDKRDNGLLYHCNGAHGAFWNVWMESQEFQIQEGDMGDYFGLAGGVNNIASERNDNDFFQYNADGQEEKLGTVIKGNKAYRCVRSANHEKPNGEWNTLELVCYNGKSYHIVNGEVVMVLDKSERKTEVGFEAVTRGKLQLQSEAAEAYYRRVMIQPLDELPAFLADK